MITGRSWIPLVALFPQIFILACCKEQLAKLETALQPVVQMIKQSIADIKSIHWKFAIKMYFEFGCVACFILIMAAYKGIFGLTDATVKWLRNSAIVTSICYGWTLFLFIMSWEKTPKAVHLAKNLIVWLYFKILGPLAAIAFGIFILFRPDINWSQAVIGILFIIVPFLFFVMPNILHIANLLLQPRLQEFRFHEFPSYPNSACCIAHISDIHVTGTKAGRTHPGKRFLYPEFTNKLCHLTKQSMDALVVTGDITDSGDRFDWDLFSRCLNKAGIETPIVLIPGNHDLILSKKLKGDMEGCKTQLRICLFLKQLHRILKQEFVSIRKDTEHLICSKDFLNQEISFIEYYLKQPPKFPGERDIDASLDLHDAPMGIPSTRKGKNFHKPQRILEDIYPLALPANRNLLIVALNSVQHKGSKDFVAENAIGFIEKDQFERLLRIVSHYSPSNVIICLHHQPGMSKSQLRNLPLFLENSAELLRICQTIDCRLILHGHIHERHFWKLGNIPIFCSGASIDYPSSIVTYFLDKGLISAEILEI